MALHRLIMLASLPLLFGACTMVGAPPPPAPPAVDRAPVPRADGAGPAAPVGEETHPAPDLPITHQVVEIALESIGTPYMWGGTDEDGFDCSGLIQFAYAQVGIRLPRFSGAQIGAGSPVTPAPELLRPGDLLGFANGGSGATDHVGLYIGDGAFIHSSSTGVRISAITEPFWQHRLVAARRIIG